MCFKYCSKMKKVFYHKNFYGIDIFVRFIYNNSSRWIITLKSSSLPVMRIKNRPCNRSSLPVMRIKIGREKVFKPLV